MDSLFTGSGAVHARVVPAPVHLGNVRQLEAAGRVFLAAVAAAAPLLPGAGALAFTGIDSMQKRVYGHAKAGAAASVTPAR
jgi:hypothetical protein